MPQAESKAGFPSDRKRSPEDSTRGARNIHASRSGPPLRSRHAARRLVVVSNRVADERGSASGGLAVAISESFRDLDGVWFGWSGKINDEADGVQPAITSSGAMKVATIDLRPGEYEGYYGGFANQCLWPILHCRPDLLAYERSYALIFQRVCRRFAQSIASLLGPDDIVWVHDFHLTGLGAELRRLNVSAPIGFFLHVPFPPPEVAATLPGHQDFFRNLFAYDLAGFQTGADARCFRRYAEERLGAKRSGETRLTLDGNVLHTGAFPIGIDVDRFSAMAADASASRQIARMKAADGDRALIVGVDRLDYTKGLPQRFAAYRRFLGKYADQRGRTLFLQVTPPTRAHLEPYRQIQKELDRLEGAIHGEFADVDWNPIRYVKRPISRRRLAALHRAARLALVTPLRDGMNLVAKEFVAAQDEADPGVLVLSKFAGAAETMTDALLVNPYDIDEVADAIRQGLTMPLNERRERNARLLAKIRRHDVHAWRRAFVNALIAARKEAPAARIAVPPESFNPVGNHAVEACQ